MTPWNRITRAGKKLLGREGSEEPRREEPEGEETPPEELEPLEPQAAAELPDDGPPPVGDLTQTATSRGLSSWIEQRAERVMARIYETRAQDLEERAQRIVHSAYERSADDLEERAVRAMRRAIEAEADRLKSAIEHGIQVKKREVRLSLLVLVVSSLVYLALYWFSRSVDS
jgi:hypothetical protein